MSTLPVPSGLAIRHAPEPPSREEPPVTRAMLLDFCRRQWSVILTVFLGTVTGTYGVVSLMTEKYQTESKILVKLGRENVDPPATVRGSVLVTGLRLQDAQNEIQILKSPEILAGVVDKIGLEAFRNKPRAPTSLLGRVKYSVKSAVKALQHEYDEVLIILDLKKRLSERDQVIAQVSDETVVEPEKDSDVIAIRTDLPDYLLSEKIQSELIAAYLAARGRVRQDYGVAEFLDDEVEEARSKLLAVENQKEELKRTQSISSAPEQQSLLLKQSRELTNATMETRTNIATLERQSEELKRQLAETPRELRSSQQEIPNPLAISLRERLATSRAQLSSLLTKYQPDSAIAMNLKSEITELENQLRAETPTTPGTVTYQVNPLWQSIEAKMKEAAVSLEGMRSRLQKQEAALGELQQELQLIDQSYARLGDIERAEKIAEENYVTLTKRRQAAEIDSQLLDSGISNVNVLQPPSSLPRPVYPPKMLIFYVSLGAGLVLGLLLSLLLEYIDDRVRDPIQAERWLQLPCLGKAEWPPEGSPSGT